MKVLITGANGMVARAAARYCASVGDDVAALTRAEFDISGADPVNRSINDIRPDAVINCAAYTNVDGAETDAEVCYAANAVGVENLATACRSIKAAFVTISTDYVFSGSKDGYYTQRDTPDPQGIYARSKREGEIRTFAAYPRSIIVRSGWIYGSGGTNFLSVIPDLLASGTNVRAISDAFGTPTFADDLAKRLRELAGADLPGVFHVTNSGEGCSYLGFADRVCEIGDFDKALLQPINHADLSRPAPRPINSKLACLISEKLGFSPLRTWDDALAVFLQKKKATPV